MRLPIAICPAVIAIAVFANPVASVAQKFQEPAKEDLQMTAYPKAPGASAIYLNYEERIDNALHMQTVYARIKVLNDAGKEDAAVISVVPPKGDFSTIEVQSKPNLDTEWIIPSPDRVPSENTDSWSGFRLTEFKARVIHSDGTITSVEPQPEAQQAANTPMPQTTDRATDVKTFRVHGVEAGSILEYHYQIRYDEHHFASPYWDIQQKYFVRHARFSFNPYKTFLDTPTTGNGYFLLDAHGREVQNIVWWPVLPAGAQVEKDSIGHFNLAISDVPPLPHDERMPPISTISDHVLFYYSPVATTKDFWAIENKRWSKAIDRAAESTPAIKSAVAALIASGDSDLDKAKKLYRSVQSLRNTDFERSSSNQPAPGNRSVKHADETLAQKSGSRQEIALLYLAMLRAAGLTAYDMRVVDRDRGAYASGFLSADQFDDDIVLLSLNGKETVLDPGEKLCPFGMVHWRHAGASGIRQSASGPAPALSPSSPYAVNTLQRFSDVTVDAKGVYNGQARFIINGQQALYWRQLALALNPDQLKKRFDQSLESTVPQGSTAQVDHFLALDTPETPLIAVVDLQGSFAPDSSGRFLLPAVFFEAHSSFSNRQARQVPVDMLYGEQVIDQLSYRFPAGFAVANRFEDSKIPWEGHAVVTIRTAEEPGKLTVARAFTRAFTTLNADEYPALHDFYSKVADLDRRQLTLASSALQSGN